VGHLSVLKILEKTGININEVTLVSIPAWEIQQAMVNGLIDAGVTWEPYLTSTANLIDGKILITSRDYPETIITTMTFDRDVIETRPDDVANVVAAYFEAVEYIKQHPQEAFAIMGKAENISGEEFASHVEGIKYLDLKDNADLFGADSSGRIYTTTQEISQFLADNNVTTNQPSASQLLNSRFVINLYKSKP
jgi:NitT/TauT family transport system substrate-binding protein